MKVTVLLADKGTSNPLQGTLNLLNAGWGQTMLTPVAPGVLVTGPQAVAVFFEVEPRYCNRPIELLMELWTQDGEVVAVPGPAGPQPMRIQHSLVVPTPGGVPAGTPGTGNTLLELAGLPLTPGGYEWRVSLAGDHQADWAARFFVVAPPQAPIFGGPGSGPGAQ